jgi:hypothetical protein
VPGAPKPNKYSVWFGSCHPNALLKTTSFSGVNLISGPFIQVPAASVAGNSQSINQYRAAANVVPRIHILADRTQAAKDFFEVTGNGHFINRILDLTVLNPEAGGTPGIVPSDHVDAKTNQFGYQQPFFQPTDQIGQILVS